MKAKTDREADRITPFYTSCATLHARRQLNVRGGGRQWAQKVKPEAEIKLINSNQNNISNNYLIHGQFY